MRSLLIGWALAALVALPAVAQPPSGGGDGKAVAAAEREYRAAVRSGNKGRIKRAHEKLVQIDREAAQDRVLEVEANQPPPPGVPQAVYDRVVQAKAAVRDARNSGDQARMVQARVDLDAAYRQLWVYQHHH